MILFFDTSALVKYFQREEGTDVVIHLVNDPQNTIWLSDLARLEFISAIHRRFRMKEINAAELEDVINYFNEALSDFKLKKIGHAVLEESETLVKTLGKTIGLRTLDAIHLATFNLFNQLSEIVFVASDETLLGAARSLSAKVINPVIGDQIV